MKKKLLYFLLAILVLDILPRAIACCRSQIGNAYFPRYETGISKENSRTVLNNPIDYSHRILFYGNSAAWGLGVKDGHTIEDYLQQMLPDYEVLNKAGTFGESVADEWILLKNERVSPGDIVIFYDGFDEMSWAYQKFPLCNIPLGLIALYCSTVQNTVYDVNQETKAVEYIKKYIGLTRVYLLSKHAQFLHIWQPFLFSQNLSNQEAQMVYAYKLSTLSWGYWYGVEDIPDILRHFMLADPQAVDFTHLLNPARDGQGDNLLFYDIVHTSPAANQMVARAIYSLLDQEF